MQAFNRPLYKWFNLIELGQLTLPRFQRFEAWTHNEVSYLLRSMLKGLPTGAALILRVDGPEQFRSKHLAGTPQDGRNVAEQLLDGQQRLKAMWKSHQSLLYDSRTVTASIKIEIEADCHEGFDEATQSTINESCNTLKFDLSELEYD